MGLTGCGLFWRRFARFYQLLVLMGIESRIWWMGRNDLCKAELDRILCNEALILSEPRHRKLGSMERSYLLGYPFDLGQD